MAIAYNYLTKLGHPIVELFWRNEGPTVGLSKEWLQGELTNIYRQESYDHDT